MIIYGWEEGLAVRGEPCKARVDREYYESYPDSVESELGWEYSFSTWKDCKAALLAQMKSAGCDKDSLDLTRRIRVTDLHMEEL